MPDACRFCTRFCRWTHFAVRMIEKPFPFAAASCLFPPTPSGYRIDGRSADRDRMRSTRPGPGACIRPFERNNRRPLLPIGCRASLPVRRPCNKGNERHPETSRRMGPLQTHSRYRTRASPTDRVSVGSSPDNPMVRAFYLTAIHGGSLTQLGPGAPCPWRIKNRLRTSGAGARLAF